MSTTQGAKTLSVPCGENLAGQLYAPLTISNNGQYVLADAPTEVVHAILFVDPGTTAAGDMVTVMDIHAGGIGLVRMSGATGAGELLVSPAASDEGSATTTGAGDIGDLGVDQVAFGTTLESGSAGDIVRFHAGIVGGPHTS